MLENGAPAIPTWHSKGRSTETQNVEARGWDAKLVEDNKAKRAARDRGIWCKSGVMVQGSTAATLQSPTVWAGKKKFEKKSAQNC